MAVKPQLPKWVPGDEAARITDPGIGKRALGWVYQEKPPFQFMNWIHNIQGHWLVGLQGGFFDIVVGSSTEKANNEATHTIDEIIDANVPAGSRVLILDGTHTLTANMALSNVDLLIISESPLAIVAVSTFQILLTGARQIARLRVTGAGAADVQLSGAGSHFEGVDLDIAAVQVTAGSTARTSGVLSGVKISSASLGDNILMTRKTPEEFIGQKNFSPPVILTWGANVSWDLDTQQVAKLTLTGATAQLDNPTNMKDGGTYLIRIIQDATGGRALTFGTAFKWVNGIVPNIPQGANEVMVISFTAGPTNMYGVGQGPFS